MLLKDKEDENMDYEAMKKRLKEEYRDVLERAEIYGLVKNVEIKVQEEMMMDLFDILLSAQEDNKPVEKIVGKDIEKFLKDYYQEYTFMDRIKSYPQKLYSIMKIIFIVEILNVFAFQEENISFFQVQSDFSYIIFGLISGVIASIIGTIIFMVIFKGKKPKARTCYVIALVLFVVSCVAAFFVTDAFEIEIKSYMLIFISFAYLAIYLIVRSIYRYKRTGTIRKAKDMLPENEFQSVSISKEIEKNLPLEFAKRYEKINKKRRKKGKPELTPKEYTDFLKRDTEKLRRQPIWMSFMYIAICIIAIVIVSVDSTLTDTIIFACVIFTLEFLIWFVLAKANTSLCNARMKVFEKCDEMGVDIIQYGKIVSANDNSSTDVAEDNESIEDTEIAL